MQVRSFHSTVLSYLKEIKKKIESCKKTVKDKKVPDIIMKDG